VRRLYEPAAYDGRDDAGNFWRSTVAPPAYPAATSHATDIAILGGGVTGLSAALHLARDHGAAVTLLDAGQPGWGASGRAGGFCCLGGGLLSDAQMRRRHGAEALAAWHRAQRGAVDLVAETLDRHAIAADTHSRGETLLAHTPRRLAALRAEAAHLGATQGLVVPVIDRPALAEHGFGSPAFHGALTVPIGFALNPLKYTLGLAGAAAGAGARICGDSAVIAIARQGDRYVLRSATAEIRARRLILATNGYAAEDLPPWMAGRTLPVQSNILVTRPLTPDELAAQGWTSRQMCYDTRTLLHYFRLMPDRRMLFGMRGNIRATPRASKVTGRALRRHFAAMFPAWRDVEISHTWSGLVCFAAKGTPYAGPLGDWPGAFAGFAYHGNGIAMGTLTGRWLAALAAGAPDTRPAPVRAPPGRFPLGRHRRVLLRLAYAGAQLTDLI